MSKDGEAQHTPLNAGRHTAGEGHRHRERSRAEADAPSRRRHQFERARDSAADGRTAPRQNGRVSPARDRWRIDRRPASRGVCRRPGGR